MCEKHQNWVWLKNSKSWGKSENVLLNKIFTKYVVSKYDIFFLTSGQKLAQKGIFMKRISKYFKVWKIFQPFFCIIGGAHPPLGNGEEVQTLGGFFPLGRIVSCSEESPYFPQSYHHFYWFSIRIFSVQSTLKGSDRALLMHYV